jgi:ABC-type branched-subunit amino acid transport system substrate-binding protein
MGPRAWKPARHKGKPQGSPTDKDTKETGMKAGFHVAAALALFAALGTPAAAGAQEIKIGEINSYSALPAFTEPYRKGWQLAIDEINAAGGVNGQKLVVVSKDDGGKPADAVTAANELVSSEGVTILAGTFFSNIGLAVSDFAKQKKVFFMAAEPLTDAVTWANGNRYTFRLRPSNYMQAAMLAEEAAKLPAKRWATVAPNYEYGQSAVAVFKQLLSAKRPDVEWVDAQWPPQGKIDDPERHLRRRSGEVRARGQHPRPVRGPVCGQLPDRRAGVPGPAEGRDAGRLDRDRLSLVCDQVAGA